MNKKTFTTAACGLFLMLGLSVIGLSGLTEAPTPEIPVSSREQIPAEVPPQYILKIHGEYLAVFDPERPEEPLEITGIHASTLRSYDREQLKIGVPVNGREELLMLLEDYGS